MPPPPTIARAPRTTTSKPFPFLSLPPELRCQVYTHYAHLPSSSLYHPTSYSPFRCIKLFPKLPLLLTSHSIHTEARPILYRHHDFRFSILSNEVGREYFYWPYENGQEEDEEGEEGEDMCTTMPDAGPGWMFHGRHIPGVLHVDMMANVRRLWLGVDISSMDDSIATHPTRQHGADFYVARTLDHVAAHCTALVSLTLEMEEDYGLWKDEWDVDLLRCRQQIINTLKNFVGRGRSLEVLVEKDVEKFMGWKEMVKWQGGGGRCWIG